MKRLLIFVTLSMLLFSCAPDPRKEAQAYEIRKQAEQSALNVEQARKQDAEMHAVALQEAKIEAEHKAATAAEWRNGLNRFIRVTFFFVIVELCVFLFYGTRSMIVSFDIASKGLAKAMARKALVSANLIYLDPKTRQFPMLLQYLGKGRYSLVNGNADDVMMLDTRSAPDRQMIATSGLTQLAGAIAQEARQSDDPAGIAVMQPAIVSAKDEMITIGGER